MKIEHLEQNFKYKKKPVVVEAFVVTKNFPNDEMPAWGKKAIKDKIIVQKDGEIIIKTLEDGKDDVAKHVADFGDYIIQGVHGELYPCKPDIFKKTYEKVEEK